MHDLSWDVEKKREMGSPESSPEGCRDRWWWVAALDGNSELTLPCDAVLLLDAVLLHERLLQADAGGPLNPNRLC